jgi:hypothetical protein
MRLTMTNALQRSEYQSNVYIYLCAVRSFIVVLQRLEQCCNMLKQCLPIVLQLRKFYQ